MGSEMCIRDRQSTNYRYRKVAVMEICNWPTVMEVLFLMLLVIVENKLNLNHYPQNCGYSLFSPAYKDMTQCDLF